MQKRAPRRSVYRLCAAIALGAALAAAPGAGCADHEPEVNRVGSPLPDSGQAESGAIVTWCQALAIIRLKCQRCHADPPQNDAPFPLVTYENTQAIYANRPIHVRMHTAVDQGFMPFVELNEILNLDPPVEDLTAEEKATLLAWLEQGARPTGGLDCP